MELRMLARRCPSGSLTLLGDLAQAIGPWGLRDWADVAGRPRGQKRPAASSSSAMATARPPRSSTSRPGCCPRRHPQVTPVVGGQARAAVPDGPPGRLGRPGRGPGGRGWVPGRRVRDWWAWSSPGVAGRSDWRGHCGRPCLGRRGDPRRARAAGDRLGRRERQGPRVRRRGRGRTRLDSRPSGQIGCGPAPALCGLAPARPNTWPSCTRRRCPPPWALCPAPARKGRPEHSPSFGRPIAVDRSTAYAAVR